MGLPRIGNDRSLSIGDVCSFEGMIRFMGTTELNQGIEPGSGGRLRSESMQRAMTVALGGDAGEGGLGLASPKLRRLICPFCGELTADSGRCGNCRARYDPLSRQASQNEMGPWFVRDESMPYRPGCSFSTIKRLVESGGIEANSVVRGPSTRQFWMLAKHTPGVASLFGLCHNCGGDVSSGSDSCGACHESFSADRDRQHLGLGPTRPLPGRAPIEILDLRAAPPAGVELVSGPAAIPLAVQDTRGEGRDGRRQSDVGGGNAGLEAAQRVDDLSRSVRSLRRAWVTERRRSWIAVGSAGVVTVLALTVILLS